MPDFAYVARDLAGQKVTGRIAAPSQREAVAQLSGQSLFPLEVSAAREAVFWQRRRVSGQLVATTYGQLAALLRSGVPLLRALSVLRGQTSHAGLKEVLSDLYERVEEGASLAEAMARHRGAFGEMAVSMIRAGGEGGFLEEALDRVATLTEQQQDLKSRTIGALAYPAFLSTVGVSVIIVLIVFFVPRFEDLFKTLREQGELPAVTDWLLATSHFLGGWGGLLLLGGLVVAILALRVRLETEPGREQADRIKLRLPLVGSVLRQLAVARFCRVLGTLLHNGVPILRALEISSDASGNRVLAAAIRQAAQNISAGQRLAVPLASSRQFPATVIEMIAVAEEANTLDTVLVDVADGLERRTGRQLDLAVRLLEPILLLILAGVVLVVVIALLVPVLKMSMTI